MRNTYDAEGRLEAVRRWSRPDVNAIDTIITRWRYDRAGRAVAEIAPGSGSTVEYSDSTEYDPAGNAVAVHTRRGHTIRMQYDALNRLVRRTIPQVSFSPFTYGFKNTTETWHFPRYVGHAAGGLEVLNTGTTGLVIPGDVEEYTYDEAGNIRTAVNRDARVHRRYHRNGSLRADTLIIRTYTGRDSTQHVYGLRYAYDLSGRRTRLWHPGALAPAPPDTIASDSVTYAYSDTMGELREIVDIMGNRFGYEHTARGELERLTRQSAYLGSTEERWKRDADGRLIRRWEAANSNTVHDDSLAYDLRGKVVNAHTSANQVRNVYSGLGTLVFSHTDFYLDPLRQPGDGEELYTADALGNHSRVERTDLDSRSDLVPSEWRLHHYEPGTGRLVRTSESTGEPEDRGPYSDTTAYDRAGNKVRFAATSFIPYPGVYSHKQNDVGTLQEQAAFYYGADQRLRVADRRTCVFGLDMTGTDGQIRCWTPYYKDRGAFEEYRYDALGRRVMVRTRQEHACAAYCNRSVTRVVWDGDQILYEVRAPGQTGAGAWMMEQDTGLEAVGERGLYGRVSYTHGAGIDRPLALYRMEYDTLFPAPVGIYPHADWRGLFDRGSFESGEATHANDGSPTRCVEVEVTTIEDSTALPPTEEGSSPGKTGVQKFCIEVEWPGGATWNSRQRRGADKLGPSSWMGSLITDHRDASGQLYRRNRYYDPQSGRFTQEDPIGLAGGLNLYGFANGDPVSYSDPYGLCTKPAGLKRGEIGICIETFIAWFPIPGVADNRGPRSDGGAFRTSEHIRVDPATGQLTGGRFAAGKSLGIAQGWWGGGAPTSDKGNINVNRWATNGFLAPPFAIDYKFSLSLSESGDVSLTSFSHDAYPSYEIWIYEEGKDPRRLYSYSEGSPRNISKLKGPGGDVQGP